MTQAELSEKLNVSPQAVSNWERGETLPDVSILLDLAGKELDSVKLSEKINQLNTSGKSRIDFVIGGSLGVSEELIQRADFRWKLSPNTFPHQLCRLIVLEQIYRSFRILHHEPYHK